jgi:hypothetical protein
VLLPQLSKHHQCVIIPCTNALCITAHCYNNYDNNNRVNVSYVFELLRAAGVPVLFDVQDWLTCPDPLFLLLQLSVLHRSLERRPRTAVTAAATAVVVRADGSAAVAGLRFADDKRDPATVSNASSSRVRCVRLGDGSGMSLWTPPLAGGGVALGPHRYANTTLNYIYSTCFI